MTNLIDPKTSRELIEKRRSFDPDTEAAFQVFSRARFADGALPSKAPQFIDLAVAHVTQCPYCIAGHTKAAQWVAAMPQELMETVWVGAEIRAGALFAHSADVGCSWTAMHEFNVEDQRTRLDRGQPVGAPHLACGSKQGQQS